MSKKKVEDLPQKLLERSADEEYAIVIKKLGNGNFSIRLNMNDRLIIGRLCGKMRWRKNKKRNNVDVGSVVLVGIRDFQENVVDIVHVYDTFEVKQLRKSGKFVDDSEELNRTLQDQDEPFDFNDI